MNAEKVYSLCCDAIRAHADLTQQDGAALIREMEKDLTAWSCSELFPVLAALAPIMQDAREQMDKATTPAGQLAALKRIAKAGAREDVRGGWVDAQGRYCVCSGYHAARLPGARFDSIPAAKGLESLDQAMQRPASGLYEIELPSVADCKAFKATHGKHDPMPIDKGRRWVDPRYLLDMLQALPGAKVYATDRPTAPIWFESEQGDGILLPVRPPKQ